MLNSLSKEDNTNDYKDCNNDYDLGEVLEFCSGKTIQKHKIRYSDGQEKTFSFDD